MTKPLFVVSTFKVKEGRVDDVKKYYKKVLDIVEANGSPSRTTGTSPSASTANCSS